MSDIDDLYQVFDLQQPPAGAAGTLEAASATSASRSQGTAPSEADGPAGRRGQAEQTPAPAQAVPEEPAFRYELPQEVVDTLLGHIGELEQILRQIDQLKRKAATSRDWRVVMMFIAGQKPRVSELAAQAKRLYHQTLGEALDVQYRDGGKTARNQKLAEYRAKRDIAPVAEVYERLERTWRDLQDLMWSCKSVAEHLDAEEGSPKFDAHPDHMFELD